jgi:hypothetical protein
VTSADSKLVVQVLIASGRVSPAEVIQISAALDDALAEGRETVETLIAAAARIWNLRRSLIPLYVVVDDFLEYQSLYFANVDDVAEHLKRCDPAWNTRLTGFVWVHPHQVKEYVEANPKRPFTQFSELSQERAES